MQKYLKSLNSSVLFVKFSFNKYTNNIHPFWQSPDQLSTEESLFPGPWLLHSSYITNIII